MQFYVKIEIRNSPFVRAKCGLVSPYENKARKKTKFTQSCAIKEDGLICRLAHIQRHVLYQTLD